MSKEYTNKDVLTIRIDHETKEKAMTLFASMGLPLSTAINIFLKQCVRESRIPFELNGDGATPASQPIKAVKSVQKTKTGRKNAAGRKQKPLY